MKIRKRNQKSTILRVLETICGFLFAIALMLLIWNIQLKKGNYAEGRVADTTPPTQNAEVTDSPILQIDQNATGERKAEQERNVVIPGWKTMTFADGKDTVSVDLYNPEKNAGYYYLTFELRVPDTEGNYETIYTSDLVEAGKHLYQITLSHALSAGVYERCILHIQPYTVEGLTPTNNADVEFTLTVQ